MNTEFGKLKFKEEALKNLGLPHIEYPIPIERFKDLIALQGQLYPDLLIYWMMEYLDDNPEDRDYYEIQLLKICEDFAEPKDTPEFWEEGFDLAYFINEDTGEWSAYFGDVNLKDHIITVENTARNQHKILCAYQQFNDTKDIKVSFYTAPTLKSLRELRTYSKKKLNAERVFNSLAHLTKKAGSLGNGFDSFKNDHYILWEYGIGYNNPRRFNEDYAFSQNLNAIPGSWVVFCIRIIEAVEKHPPFRELAGLPELERLDGSLATDKDEIKF